MSYVPLPTDFAPAERASTEVLNRQVEFFRAPANELMAAMLDAVGDIVVVLNEQRQIVYANLTLRDALGMEDDSLLYGLRPGEVLSCAHARETDGGCGTTEACRTCGAVKAILTSLNGVEAVEECRIAQEDGTALDLQVRARPMFIHGQTFVAFSAKDISSQKRRHVLERIFYHDILNHAGVVSGFARLLHDQPTSEVTLISETLRQVADQLIEEIKAQRDLAEAEANELTTRIVPIRSLELLHSLKAAWEKHTVAEGRSVVISPTAQDVEFTTDAVLIQRVLGNMIKNALEASAAGETVTLSCSPASTYLEFTVHNPAVIPVNAQLQVFQRSFSTKGKNRGLGTYSMKLLTERYLQGKVFFTSNKSDGTCFFARYPYKMS